jgi:hypothetical protein
MTDDDGSPRFELPDRGTLLVLGFVVLLGFGWLGVIVPGFGLEPPPRASGAPAFARVQATVIFGTSRTDDCAVANPANRFAPGTSVWWTAWLAYALEPHAEALVVVRHDGIEIDRVRVGSEQSATTWAVLCAEAPIGQGSAGTYRVEVRDISDRVTYAAGEYEVAGS